MLRSLQSYEVWRGELGASAAVITPAPIEISVGEGSEWDALSGRLVAMYSLQESALRRAGKVLKDHGPGARVATFHDHIGGSPAMRKASATADIFVIATGAAKHAATTFIEGHRPKQAITLYARGQGSSSLLNALREYFGANEIDS